MAGLPWIQLHVDLPRHPKSLRLAVRLKDERAWTYMAQLWLWCAEHVQNGCIKGPEAAETIEYAAGWRGEPQKLFVAAMDAGFLTPDGDGAIIVHGWEERARPHREKREKDAERHRAMRAGVSIPRVGTSDDRPSDVARTSNGRRGESSREREKEKESERENKLPNQPKEQKAEAAAEPATSRVLALELQELPGIPVKPGSAFVCFLREKYGDIRDPWDFEERCLAAFPGIDLLAEALKAYAKEGSDPRRKKSKHGPYLTNWFGYAQQNASRGMAGGPNGKTPHKATAAPSHPDSWKEPVPF